MFYAHLSNLIYNLLKDYSIYKVSLIRHMDNLSCLFRIFHMIFLIYKLLLHIFLVLYSFPL